jgi:AhpD family alkylhydroperoxidase
MARVRNIPSSELPPDLAAIYERFAGQYGPFRNQAGVFAHVPAALRHLMAMLLELREAATLPKRLLELAIVTVSKLNKCEYCVAHHTPFLIVEGVSAAVARLKTHFSEAQLVELTLRITLCGFFNKFNDALGIEEEPETAERLAAISVSAE